MRVSLDWLKEYVDINGIEVDFLVEGITAAGLEVETVSSSKPVKGIVTAKVKSVVPHPDAKKLNVCSVFDGETDLQIVCGAPNVAQGQTVVLATTGTVMPDGLEINKVTLRGVESNGMICSERELGLSDEHNGILVLDGDYEAGLDANDILGLGDTVLEFGITPNRGDCLSIYGIARDISAVFERALIKKAFPEPVSSSEKASEFTAIKIENYNACPFYSARILKDVKIGTSPVWMQRRLRSAGMRPVNNVVDVTNYVMLEYGQPMHAFDLNIIDKGIVVRNAEESEKIVTLDGKERVLNEDILVIADHSKVLGVAGVMGGEYSGINSQTTSLLLECAFFNPEAVSISAKKLNMKSDSSFRYTRGIDASMTLDMLNYAAALLNSICGGSTLEGVLSDGVLAEKTKSCDVSFSGINKLMGINFTVDEISKLLKRLDIAIEKCPESNDRLKVTVPAFRRDIVHTADIAEEVARLYGLDNIPVTLPNFHTDASPLSYEDAKRKELRYKLAALGLNEAVNFSFMSEKYLSLFDDKMKFVHLLNPLSEELDTLRTLVYPGIIKNLDGNWRQGERSIRMFELATVFTACSGDDRPAETRHLGIGIMGDFYPLSWVKQDAHVDTFYHLKNIVENVGGLFNLSFEYRIEADNALHPGKSATIYAHGEKIGIMGALHPELEEELDLKGKIYIAELNFDKLTGLAVRDCTYSYFSKYPSIDKDLSLIVPGGVQALEITECVKSISPLIKNVVIFDRYTGKGIGKDEVSLAFRIWFSSMTETLSDEQINPLLEKAVAVLSSKYGAKLR